MSLINEALKRAKQSQHPATAPLAPSAQFQLVDPDRQARHGLGMLALAVLAVSALLALLFLWQLSGRHGDARLAQPRPSAPETPRVSGPAPAPAPAMVPANPVPAPAAAPPAVAPAAPPAQSANLATNPPAMPEAAPAKPAPPKLQGIIFDPNRPSAIISGQVVFVGDRFGDLAVVAVTRRTATLVGGGVTNVLSLGP
jgi:hypothetical protein